MLSAYLRRARAGQRGGMWRRRVKRTRAESWVQRRPITTDFSRKGHEAIGFDGQPFTMAYNKAEPNGYMAATVGADGIINLITSRNLYRFNLAWLQTPAAEPKD